MKKMIEAVKTRRTLLIFLTIALSSADFNAQTLAKPSDEKILQMIQSFLLGAPASGSDFIGMQFYGWMSTMRNVKFVHSEIVKIGELQEKMGVRYWPVRARFSGSFDAQAPLCDPERKTFDTTANFIVRVNDFGELKVDFMQDEPIVAHGGSTAKTHKQEGSKFNAAEPNKANGSSSPNRKASPESHAKLVSIFSALPSLKGETAVDNSTSKYSFILHVKSMDTPSGKWTGELEWTSLNSIHKVEGTLSEAKISFKGTEYVKKGKIMLDSIYDLGLDDSESRLTGSWRWKLGSKGGIWIDLN